MYNYFKNLCLGICLFVLLSGSVFAQERYALVIGNGDYKTISRLSNPANDAADIKNTLSKLNFEVDLITNATLEQMEDASVRFKNKLSRAKDSYGFFFYAGHGVQAGGNNYLIPVDADIKSESFVKGKAFNVQDLYDELSSAGNELNVIVLDACRDNPFGWSRGGTRGLSVVSAQPAGSIIVYATSAGKTAADGTGRNGLFTSGLLKNLDSANVEVKEIFNRTGADVLKDSGGEQRPAVYSQFFGNAYFSGSGGAVKAAAAEKESTKKVKPVTIKAIDYTVNFAPDNKLIPLFKTIKDGNIEKVREQLNMRQNPNGKDSNGNPALFYAIEAGDPEIVKLLIANKANVNLTNNKKQTPLAFAAYKAKNEIVEILVKSGADVNQTDGNKITALQVARGAKNEALVKYLIDAGAKD